MYYSGENGWRIDSTDSQDNTTRRDSRVRMDSLRHWRTAHDKTHEDRMECLKAELEVIKNTVIRYHTPFFFYLQSPYPIDSTRCRSNSADISSEHLQIAKPRW
jgi:hypothetical protein